jgi:hypothetical protein
MKTYSCTQVQKLFNKYVEKCGEVLELEEGVLGYGTTICFGDGLKTAVIKEQFVNEWSSTHTVRFYNNMPQKYASMIE